MRPIILLLLLCVVFCSNARRYYFSAAGSDASSGTSPATAWQTISKLYSVTPVAGDSILFRSGDTFSGLVYLSAASSGTVAAPTLVGSYGSGRATINAGNGSGIFLYNTGGFIIRNINIRGAGDSVNTASGIYLYTDTPRNVQLPAIHIDSVDVSGFKEAGVQALAYPSDTGRSGYSGLRITNVVAHHNGNAGIFIWGNFKTSDTLFNHHNLYIGHCTAYNNRGIGSGVNGSGIEVSQVDSAMIEYCIAYNNGVTGGGGVGIWAWDASRVTIQHCESHHNHTTRSDGDGFDLDGGVVRSAMQYNYAHDNDGAGYLVWQFDGARPMHDNVVRYNISENDSRTQNGYYGCLAIGMGDTSVNSGVHNLSVYHNTFYKTRIPGTDTMQGPAVSLDGRNITGVLVSNNIFSLDSTSRFVQDYYGAGVTFVNNDYWSKKGFWITRGNTHYTSMAAWAAATGQERRGSMLIAHLSDPRFVNGGKVGTIGNADSLQKLSLFYGLNTGSPMVDSAFDLAAMGINEGPIDCIGTVALSGVARDIGACEKKATASVASEAKMPSYEAFPVPFRDVLFIRGGSVSDKDAALLITDISGRVILRQVGLSSISTVSLAPGMYVLLIRDGSGHTWRQIVYKG